MRFIWLLFLTTFSAFADTPPPARWKITTRWDYSVRQDGRYRGFANRELQEVFIRNGEVSEGWEIGGEARVLGSLKHNGRPVAARLEGQEEMNFILSASGEILEADNSYPRLRGFPSLPPGPIEPGDFWAAPLDILLTSPEGEKTLSRQLVSYSIREEKDYRGQRALFADVQWAMRHPPLLTGTRRGILVLDSQTLSPIMARLNLKERRSWPGSPLEERNGFVLIFWDDITPMDKAAARQKFEQHFASSNLDEMEIRETGRGLSVTLRNLLFQADSPELLPESLPVLDELADILKTIAGRSILIRGHTADVGRPEDEQALSEERARAVADELTARGIKPQRLIYEGVGSSEPAASNLTEEGRRQNRRVELLVLED